jgi:hypothetical protein
MIFPSPKKVKKIPPQPTITRQVHEFCQPQSYEVLWYELHKKNPHDDNCGRPGRPSEAEKGVGEPLPIVMADGTVPVASGRRLSMLGEVESIETAESVDSVGMDSAMESEMESTDVVTRFGFMSIPMSGTRRILGQVKAAEKHEGNASDDLCGPACQKRLKLLEKMGEKFA